MVTDDAWIATKLALASLDLISLEFAREFGVLALASLDFISLEFAREFEVLALASLDPMSLEFACEFGRLRASLRRRNEPARFGIRASHKWMRNSRGVLCLSARVDLQQYHSVPKTRWLPEMP